MTEGFEGTQFPPANWSFTGNSSLWNHVDTIGAYGLSSKSMYANYYGVQSGTQNFESVRIDLTSGTPPVYLGFSHAYARYSFTYVDTLEISVSDDCGASWNSIYNKWDVALCTDLTFYSGVFYPTPSQWTTDYLDISAYIGQVIKVRFEAESGYGNDLYLDDINIYHGLTEVDEHSLQSLGVYPSPTRGKVFISDPAHILKSYLVCDAQGRCLQEERNPGSSIDMSKYADGLYFIKLQTEKTSVLRKVSLVR